MEKSCDTCGERERCKAPCKAVRAILWKDNRVMERCFGGVIMCYPQRGEVHFSELEDFKQVENFSTDAVLPWSSGDLKLRQTTVFVERFFNRVSCRELAERFGVKENTIVSMYVRAVEQLQKIIEALDARREGLKATKAGRFSDDERMFMLAEIFGFNRREVGEMFSMDRKLVSSKVKRMADRYEAAFKADATKSASPEAHHGAIGIG